MKNGNDVPLTELRWRVAAYAPGDTVNLAENTYNARDTAGQVNCSRGPSGKTACHCRRCVPAIGRRPWNSEPSTCKVRLPIDVFPP